jgi:hypothetical protein
LHGLILIAAQISDFGVSRLSPHNPSRADQINGCVVADFWQNEPDFPE